MHFTRLFFMAIYHNASTISLLHNCLFVLGALPATMVRNIWLTAINPIDLVFSKECCSKKNKALLLKSVNLQYNTRWLAGSLGDRLIDTSV